MKTLIGIWIAVAITAVGTTHYISSEVDSMVSKRTEHTNAIAYEASILNMGTPDNKSLQSANFNPQMTIDSSQLQGMQLNLKLKEE